jgi:serine/threonine protein phosphatase PrpC
MVALRIVDQAGRTDVGRQRHANEDSFLMDSPLFAVADGMGGAKAGEVASQIAVDAFKKVLDEEVPPEKRLEAVARGANRRIYEMAKADEARRGMGTTLTVALVGDQEVALAHVGDSRAYLLRDDRLEQLTRDHSLVAELERTGQLTPEAAEHHPQKSIITRALGPEPDVQVDTHTHAARPGDVFLLCSDGLTTMLSVDEVNASLRSSGSLDEAAEALVRAANQSGGKDNITVVLFRLGEGETAAVPAEAESTMAGELTAEDISPQTTDHSPQAPALEPLPPEPVRPAAARRRPRRARRVLGVLVVLLLVGAAGFGLFSLGRQVYFVGTNESGLVTLYRGVPYDLPFDVDLYQEQYASGVPVAAIPRSRRDRVLDHEWRGKEDAVDLMRDIEQGKLER